MMLPAPPAARELLDVACATANNCLAVGFGPSGSTNGTGLSGFWNGTSWRLVTAR